MSNDTQQLLTALVQATAALTQQSDKSDQKLEALVDQVGRLSEEMTTFRLSMQNGFAEMRTEIKEGFAETRAGFAEIRAITQQQAEVARIQAQNVAELIAVAKQRS
jgi:methyl-accepting chemotaxis protein